MQHIPVVVVGGGQAGLAVSRELTSRDVEHMVLERGRVGQAWRDRWDSFRLVTPNWTVQLPGGAYDGDDPDGFMPRGEVVTTFERYARRIAAPVREGVDVRSIDRPDGRFLLETTDGELTADRVVLATGAFQRSHRPAAAAELPADLSQLDVADYRNPDALPVGPILIVGSGQSGCQIAEELTDAGRDVMISCGRVPWVPRRIAGRDLAWWALESGFMDQAVEALPHPSARLIGNVLASGHKGGHALHLRTLQRAGVRLAGHFVGAEGRVARFAPDLAESVAWGDARHLEFMEMVRRTALERGLDAPDSDPPPPFDDPGLETLDLGGFGAVLFAGGYRPDYRSWLPWPDAFDEMGFPVHHDGASTVVPGLSFVGVHFLRKRKSSLLFGVGEDAAIVADMIQREPAPTATPPRLSRRST